MRYFDWGDFFLTALMWVCGLLLVLMLVAIPFAVKDSMDFRKGYEAKGGTTISGRDIRLCVVDGKIVDGN